MIVLKQLYCFSVTAVEAESEDDFVLWADESSALLAGGRKEIDPNKDVEFTKGGGADLLHKGLLKEANNIILEKKKL